MSSIDLLNCVVLDRQSLEVKSAFQSTDWQIKVDYLLNEKSYFVPIGSEYTARQGDFIVVKHDDFNRLIGTSFKPLYVGIISSFEDGKINACHIYNLLNFDIVTVRITGSNAALHLQQLITKYLLNDPGKGLSNNVLVTTDLSQVAFSYQPSEPPSTANLTEYCVEIFRKYNIVWDVESLSYTDDKTLQINTKIYQETSEIALKNNSVAFQNWSIYVSPGGQSDFNKLSIVDATTTSMLEPRVLSTWYIQVDGGLTQSLNDNVYKPTTDRVALYDMTAEDKPTYEELARSELSASRYSHEITFSLMIDNEILPFDQLAIGTQASLIYSSAFYSSVMTGYTISPKSHTIDLSWGYVRSTLKQAFTDLAASIGGGGNPIVNLDNGVTGILGAGDGGTGISADSKIELLSELGALSMADATPIPAVANLDGYRTHGAYCCNTTANAVTVLGIPKDLVRAFRLWVWPSLINSNGQPSPSYWTQLIMDFNGCIWTRQDRSGSEDIWSEWSRIWSSADPPLVLTQTVYGITFVWVKHGRNVVCVWNGTTTQAIASSTVWLTIENTDYQPYATTARGSSTVSASVASSMTMSLDGTVRNAHNTIPQGASPWGSMAYISKT